MNDILRHNLIGNSDLSKAFTFFYLILLNSGGISCGDGYTFSTKDLDGEGKQFSNPGEGIENCMDACNNRGDCTSFEYNHGGEEGFKCGTYSGGDSNLNDQDDTQLSTWTTCVKN